MQFSSVSEANSYRLKAIVERLSFIFNGGTRFDPAEFSSLCLALARGVDYALTISDIPGVAHNIPAIIKMAYQRRENNTLLPAIMLLLISAKNACKSGWFHNGDADELTKMANELFCSFVVAGSLSTGLDDSLVVISKIMQRFYPHLKFCSLIVSLEAKPGYEVLTTDFQIPRNLPAEEKIMLVVVQTDNLETSACIVSPPQVSFFVNGKGVESRTNKSMNTAPQLPTDVTRMLKYGTNMFQSFGCFNGNFFIALAYISKLSSFNALPLQDYVQPFVIAADADSEIIEGASRITLNCPFSFKRIYTPVKGQHCKHRQCFDYQNFMVMNSRQPSWRCPFCNQPVSCIDLRRDRTMCKMLEEVPNDVSVVIISADGSWKPVVEHSEKKDQVDNGAQAGNLVQNMESESDMRTNTITDVVDLTTEDDRVGNQSNKHYLEPEDTKPFKHTQELSGSHVLPEPSLTHYASMPANMPNADSARNGSPSLSSGSFAFASQNAHTVATSESLLPDITNAVVRALNQEPLIALSSSQSAPSCYQLSQVRQLVERSMQLPQVGNLIAEKDVSMPITPEHVNRSHAATQALPVQDQDQSPIALKRTRIDGPNLSSLSSNESSFVLPTTFKAVASGFRQDIQKYLTSQTLSATQTTQPCATSVNMQETHLPNPRSNYANQTFSNLVHSSRVTTSSTIMATSSTTSSTQAQQRIEVPFDHNWQPTGKMRGSLTGNAYSDALSKYVSPSSQPAPRAFGSSTGCATITDISAPRASASSSGCAVNTNINAEL